MVTKELDPMDYGISSQKMWMFAQAMYNPASDTFDNGTESGRTAGYQGTDNTLAVRANKLIRNGKIIKAKAAIRAKTRVNSIATRSERQQFWTEMYKDSNKQPSDRLRASELLGKSECDFIEKTINLNADIPIDPQLRKQWLKDELARLETNTKTIEAYDKTDTAIAKRY